MRAGFRKPALKKESHLVVVQPLYGDPFWCHPFSKHYSTSKGSPMWTTETSQKFRPGKPCNLAQPLVMKKKRLSPAKESPFWSPFWLSFFSVYFIFHSIATPSQIPFHEFWFIFSLTNTTRTDNPSHKHTATTGYMSQWMLQKGENPFKSNGTN